MKLFDDKDKYTEEALQIDYEITKAVRDIVKPYADNGYSIRELLHIAAMAALTLECELILERDHEAWKKKKVEEEIS